LYVFSPKNPEREMTYLVKTFQRQGNEFDCGVFAIAFATSLANCENPATRLYDPKTTEESPCGVHGSKEIDVISIFDNPQDKFS
jgi:hypothetical protein